MSFFDQFEFDSKTYKLYNEVTAETKLNLSKRVLFEGELTIKSAKGLFKTRYFKIQDRKLLMFSKDSSANPHGYFDLMTFISINLTTQPKKKQELYSFRMKKYSKFYDFYSSDYVIIKNWFSTLKFFCISEGFNGYYDKLESLGKGHFAQVFKVKHKRSGDMFAAKFINKDMPLTNKDLIYKEIKILKELPKNEHILKIFEIFEEEDELILILELMEGGDVYQQIRKHYEYSEKEACYIFNQILKAVHFLHCNGVVHRDIKPENLLLSNKTKYPLVKLADFSLAEYFLDKKLSLQCGTPGYIAPEVFIDGIPYDESVDIFSMGVTLFMILSGMSPFKGKEAKIILEKNKFCLVKYKQKKWTKISKRARKLVSKMLQKSPQNRIVLSSILTDKWFKHSLDIANPSPTEKNDNIQRDKHKNYSCLTYRSPCKITENLEKETQDEGFMKPMGTATLKNQSISTRPTSTVKLTSSPKQIEHNKLFNSINSIFLSSETSMMSQNSCISNLSKESSFESLTKKSKFSMLSINVSEKYIPSPKDEVKGKSNWMMTGTDHVLSYSQSIKKSSSFSYYLHKEEGEENVIFCEELHELNKFIYNLKANCVQPKLILKF